MTSPESGHQGPVQFFLTPAGRALLRILPLAKGGDLLGGTSFLPAEGSSLTEPGPTGLLPTEAFPSPLPRGGAKGEEARGSA